MSEFTKNIYKKMWDFLINAEKKNKKSSKKVKPTESRKLYIYGDYEE